MVRKPDTQPAGQRYAPPPPKLTGLAMSPEGPQPDVLISLEDSLKCKLWAQVFKGLGYSVVIASGPASYASFLNRGGLKRLQFVLTDSITGARLMDEDQVFSYLLVEGDELDQDKLFRISHATALIIESEDGSPAKCEVVTNPEL